MAAPEPPLEASGLGIVVMCGEGSGVATGGDSHIARRSRVRVVVGAWVCVVAVELYWLLLVVVMGSRTGDVTDIVRR